MTDLQRDPPSALHAAAAANDAVRVAELAASAVSPPANSTWAWASETAGAAAQRGHSAAVAALLDAGAAVDRGVELGPLGALWAQSPLHAPPTTQRARRRRPPRARRRPGTRRDSALGLLRSRRSTAPRSSATRVSSTRRSTAAPSPAAASPSARAAARHALAASRRRLVPRRDGGARAAPSRRRPVARRGARPARDAVGAVAAHRAAQLGHADVVDALLAGGADPGRGLFNGPLGVQSPRDAALDAGYKAIAAKIEGGTRRLAC